MGLVGRCQSRRFGRRSFFFLARAWWPFITSRVDVFFGGFSSAGGIGGNRRAGKRRGLRAGVVPELLPWGEETMGGGGSSARRLRGTSVRWRHFFFLTRDCMRVG